MFASIFSLGDSGSSSTSFFDFGESLDETAKKGLNRSTSSGKIQEIVASLPTKLREWQSEHTEQFLLNWFTNDETYHFKGTADVTERRASTLNSILSTEASSCEASKEATAAKAAGDIFKKLEEHGVAELRFLVDITAEDLTFIDITKLRDRKVLCEAIEGLNDLWFFQKYAEKYRERDNQGNGVYLKRTFPEVRHRDGRQIRPEDIDARMECNTMMALVSTLFAGFMFTGVVEVGTLDLEAASGYTGPAFLCLSTTTFCLSLVVVIETTVEYIYVKRAQAEYGDSKAWQVKDGLQKWRRYGEWAFALQIPFFSASYLFLMLFTWRSMHSSAAYIAAGIVAVFSLIIMIHTYTMHHWKKKWELVGDIGRQNSGKKDKRGSVDGGTEI